MACSFNFGIDGAISLDLRFSAKNSSEPFSVGCGALVIVAVGAFVGIALLLFARCLTRFAIGVAGLISRNGSRFLALLFAFFVASLFSSDGRTSWVGGSVLLAFPRN
jgi:hypothetical protein